MEWRSWNLQQWRTQVTQAKPKSKIPKRTGTPVAASSAKQLLATQLKLKQETAQRVVAEKMLEQTEIHHKKLFAESRNMQEQLRYMSRKILRAQEDERKRISRELHDEITQILTGIKIGLAGLTRETSLNSHGIKKKIAETQRMVEESVNIVYRFARELRPALLDDLGLIPALHSFMKGMTKRTGVHVHFTADSKVENLSILKKTMLFRVAQSALINVVQHAGIEVAEVTITKAPEGIVMEIKDNGKSFNADAILMAKRPRRLGLLSMRERVEMVGGRFSVHSAPGKGTVVQVSIPVRPVAVVK
jgi:signal transduction histidine kinase